MKKHPEETALCRVLLRFRADALLHKFALPFLGVLPNQSADVDLYNIECYTKGSLHKVYLLA